MMCLNHLLKLLIFFVIRDQIINILLLEIILSTIYYTREFSNIAAILLNIAAILLNIACLLKTQDNALIMLCIYHEVLYDSVYPTIFPTFNL